MQKLILLCLVFLALYTSSDAQVINRFPNIQSPDQTSAIIAWRRTTSAVGKVKWGTSATALNDSIIETAAAQIHALTIPGLQPNTKYYYHAYSDTMSTATEYFYTAKPDSVRDLTFLTYGDCGFNNSTQNTIAALMAAQTSEFAVVVGDIDQLVGNAYDVDYYQHYTGMLKNQCHFTAIGNHDVITNNTNYTDAFHLPHNNPANSEKYYSFTWGNAKFITIDGNSAYTAGSAQYVWLENELKCNNSEWTFVYFHQPPWSNGWDASYYIPFTPFYQYQGNTDMRTSIVPLFEKYHVDVVLNGHTHNYERGIYHGVRYFIAGGAGGATPDSHTNSNAPNIQFEQSLNNYMKWSIQHDGIHYDAYNLSGAIIDSATFGKTFTPYSSSITTADETCLQSNGSASVSVAGPHPPYTVLWSTTATTSSISNLSSGAYTVTIKDTNLCPQVLSFNIQNHNGSGSASISAPDTSICKGSDLVLTATLNDLFHPHWNTGDSTVAITIHTGGIYSLSAVDSLGCGAVSNALHISTDSVVHGHIYTTQDTFLAVALASSVTAATSYHWDFGDGHSVVTATDTVSYAYADSGTYLVTLITTQMCGADTSRLIVLTDDLDTVAGPSGIVYMTGAEVKVHIAPNPMSTQALVMIKQSAAGEAMDAKLYSIQGKMIADLGKTQNDQLTIRRGNLVTGQYILKLSNQKTSVALRLEIQ
ncbi:MAG: C-terminal target protein [Bacteroidetes bacterium]|nr:C-terminal target protein [Bacteroidota bacterium]